MLLSFDFWLVCLYKQIFSERNIINVTFHLEKLCLVRFLKNKYVRYFTAIIRKFPRLHNTSNYVLLQAYTSFPQLTALNFCSWVKICCFKTILIEFSLNSQSHLIHSCWERSLTRNILEADLLWRVSALASGPGCAVSSGRSARGRTFSYLFKNAIKSRVFWENQHFVFFILEWWLSPSVCLDFKFSVIA